MRIALGSTNPLIIEGVEKAFSRVFPGETIDVYPYNVAWRAEKGSLCDADMVRACDINIKEIKKSLTQETVDFYVSVQTGVDMNSDTIGHHMTKILTKEGLNAIGKSACLQMPEDVALDIVGAVFKCRDEFISLSEVFQDPDYEKDKTEEATRMALLSLKWQLKVKLQQFK